MLAPRALLCVLLAGSVTVRAGEAPAVVFPLDRAAYIIGELVPLGLRARGEVKLEAIDGAGTRLLVYAGESAPLVLATGSLAPGWYSLHLNGADTGAWFHLASPVRRSSGALIDEATPSRPRLTREQQRDPAQREAAMKAWREQVVRTLRATRIDAAFAMCAAEMGRNETLDLLAHTGTMLFVNPYTRPMSFNPARVYEPEMAAFNQRLALMAQANARYPNFAGFCFNFDPTGFLGRKMLMVYWGWGRQEAALRAYIERSDQAVYDEFTRRTGLKPVTTEEYVSYLLSIGRPEFTPAIDLPTARWLEEMARYLKPLPEAQRAELEKRIDAWAAYLMGLYEESHKSHLDALRAVTTSLVHTSSINLDHCPVRLGQYAPSAYRPLDLRYMTAWNDQVAGPDYAWQWLLSAAMLNANRGREPVWLAHSLGMVHGQAAYPGKLVRAIAHGLAHGASGAGFALEGFSTVLGGMNKHTHWANAKGTGLGAGLLAGREFLDRFAFLATECRGDHGVGILYSRSQMARQHVSQGFGTHAYKALVTLTRLGYTPRFVTEEAIAEKGVEGVRALVVVGQTFPLPKEVIERIDAFVKEGGRVLADGSTTVTLPGAEPLGVTIEFQRSGKPHNWSCPNLPKGSRHIDLAERWHRQLAAPMLEALGDTGRAWLVPAKGADSRVTVMQIDGGPDAKYLVCINDSHIQSHTDWFQVKETLVPGKAVPPGAVLYDLNEEKLLGPVRAIECDLTTTPARVFAILRREVGHTVLAAHRPMSQDLESLVELHVADAQGKPLTAALPSHLAVLRPDGEAAHEQYVCTPRTSPFHNSYGVAANAPTGKWRVLARSQLTGQTVEASFDVVSRLQRGPLAKAIEDRVIVRKGRAIGALLGTEGARLAVPLFDTPGLPALRSVAEEAQKALARTGVELQLRLKPETTTYWLAYDPTPEQIAENARADRGDTIGRIKTTTVNRNDYFATLGGYAFGGHVLLLDLVGRGDNPMAEHLADAGLLWPEASDAFPGPGRAIIHLVQRAFHPKRSAIVIQAPDAAGLRAGVGELAKVHQAWINLRRFAEKPVRAPTGVDDIEGMLGLARAIETMHKIGPRDDWVADSVERGRASLFLTQGLAHEEWPDLGYDTRQDVEATRLAAKPFRMRFPDKTPIPEAEARTPPAAAPEPITVPAAVEPERFIPQLLTAKGYVEAWTPGKKWPADLRFADATLLVIDVRKPGKTAVVAEGTFRYSDRRPRSQASWEDLLALRDRIVPKERRPMAFEVLLDDRPAGRLDPLATATRDVPLDTPPWHAKQKPKTVAEEVVTRLGGTLDLPAGTHRLLLIHRHMVDGHLDKLHIGVAPE